MLKPGTIGLLALCAAALMGCDAATELAGDAVRAEARNAVVTQCQASVEDAGLIAGRIASVCGCAADTFLADESFTVADIEPARLEEIVNACVAQTSAE